MPVLSDEGLLRACGLTAVLNGFADFLVPRAAHAFYFKQGTPFNEATMMWTAFGRMAVGVITLYLSTGSTPRAAKGRLLRVLGAVLLAAGASHAHNWWIGLLNPLVAANWGGGSALLGALCLLRAARRPASGSAAGKAD
ncbi:hypothetical protein ABPG77_006655 [Micractinium sp. CCAP 211/92]